MVVLVTAGLLLINGGDSTQASPSPTVSPSGSPSASPSPQGKPGTQTGTVDPQPAPTAVACGAQAPKGAGTPKPQFAGPPPMKIDPSRTHVATMETSCGTIVIELDPKTAPQTVNSFVFLANRHFFDGQYFTRIDTSIDVLQGGDPTGTGSGGPGYSIPDELQGNEQYAPGVFAMANAGANTGGSQSSSSRARTVTSSTPTRTTRSSATSPAASRSRSDRSSSRSRTRPPPRRETSPVRRRSRPSTSTR